MADRKRGLERRGKPAGGPAVLMLNKQRTQAPEPVKPRTSWWIDVPDEKFGAAVAERSRDSWGAFATSQLTTASTVTPEARPLPVEFAPRKP